MERQALGGVQAGHPLLVQDLALERQLGDVAVAVGGVGFAVDVGDVEHALRRDRATADSGPSRPVACQTCSGSAASTPAAASKPPARMLEVSKVRCCMLTSLGVRATTHSRAGFLVKSCLLGPPATGEERSRVEVGSSNSRNGPTRRQSWSPQAAPAPDATEARAGSGGHVLRGQPLAVSYTLMPCSVAQRQMNRRKGEHVMAADPPSHAQAVIIGGGVIGCSVAYHLAKIGWREVVLLERKQLTCGTTWHAAGLIGQLRATPNLTRLAKYSAELYLRLEAETGQPTGFKQNGSIGLARTAARLAELRRQAAMGRACGLEVHELSPGRSQSAVPADRGRRSRRRRPSSRPTARRIRSTSRRRWPRARARTAPASSRAARSRASSRRPAG